MIDIIPSKQMRKYYENVGFEFSDFQKATLIWNSPNHTRKDRLDSLKELSDVTKDNLTTKQIHERLLYEKESMERFLDNDLGEYVYVVEDREDGCSCGFFASYEIAVKYALRYMKKYQTKCRIEKQYIIKDNQIDEYNGESVAGVNLDRNASLIDFWSRDELQESMGLFSEGRFENSFIVVPFDWEEGTIVRDVVSENCYLLATGKKEWQDFLQNVENRKDYVDFSDVQVMVYEVEENGRWRHLHINPMFLEEVTESNPEYYEQKRRYRKIPVDIRYQMKL